MYTHQLVLGMLLGVLGWFAREPRLQLHVSRFLCGAHVVYGMLDIRASDSWLGNGLYRGPASIVPGLICVAVAILFGHLAVCRKLRDAAATQ